MGTVKRDVYKCDQCGWEWIPRKQGGIPACCPNRECRSFRWNQGGLGGKFHADDKVLSAGAISESGAGGRVEDAGAGKSRADWDKVYQKIKS